MIPDQRSLFDIPENISYLNCACTAPLLKTALAAKLSSEQIYISIRGDSIRVAPHLYNTEEDIDMLLDIDRLFKCMGEAV